MNISRRSFLRLLGISSAGVAIGAKGKIILPEVAKEEALIIPAKKGIEIKDAEIIQNPWTPQEPELLVDLCDVCHFEADGSNNFQAMSILGQKEPDWVPTLFTSKIRFTLVEDIPTVALCFKQRSRFRFYISEPAKLEPAIALTFSNMGLLSSSFCVDSIGVIGDVTKPAKADIMAVVVKHRF